ncbi:MAG: 5'/3'-nucleotidase SurE [Spirochaetes bacterium]|nr:5'/3'-nucleotidase SurE [Spirochaetota bacterium]
MKIIITNDDGIEALGINSLFEILSKKHEVYMIAPDRQRSACSNAITIHGTVKLKKTDSRKYSLSGFPADCVNFGLCSGMFPEPDIVISGINHGPNMGDDIYFSGTVAGARAGYIHFRSAIAASFESFTDFSLISDASEFVRDFAEEKFKSESSNFFFNINYPSIKKESIKGTKLTHLGKRKYVDRYDFVLENSKFSEYRLEGVVDSIHKDGSDVTELSNGYISITPLHLDTTDYAYFKRSQ